MEVEANDVTTFELTAEHLDVILRHDMASFVRATFAEIMPGVPLVWAEYLDLISARLKSVVDGDIHNLIITLPPRHLKSVCVSVALPSFFLGHHPSAQVMCVSYGMDLANSFAAQTRTVMNSDFYKRIFPTRLAGRKNLHAFATAQGGIRRATSIEGVSTGVGADLLIFDDPQKPNETLSEAVRRSTNGAYENTFLSRRNNPATCRTVIVMQRLHEDDFVSHVLALGGDWEVLNLPAVAEEDEGHTYATLVGEHTYRRATGEALHPARIPLAQLGLIRTAIGEAVWATQYMQRPAPAGGGVVKIEWFKRYVAADLPTQWEEVIQSWDTASTVNASSDYSVCTTWGRKDKFFYLLDVFRKRLAYPDLKRAVVQQANLHGATTILIEEQSSGIGLLQDLKNDGVPHVRGVKSTTNKETRMEAQTAAIEGGFIHIPAEAHWVPDYLHEMSVFPKGRHDDQVDSTSQALKWFGDPDMKGYGFWRMAVLENQERERLDPPPSNKTEYAVGCVEWQEEQRR